MSSNFSKSLLNCRQNAKPSGWKHIGEFPVIWALEPEECDEDGKVINEPYHFLLQQVRILRDKPSFRKVMQLALNIGQLQGSSDPDLLERVGYAGSGLDRLSTYMSDEDVAMMSARIPQAFAQDLLHRLDTPLS
mmetsp:Transcript_51349/g.134117  ORF Transcript_51349/g.134117 Transcript_51349/m.134117 type:complete len:134 (-) Transcript_51349:257-658(-)